MLALKVSSGHLLIKRQATWRMSGKIVSGTVDMFDGTVVELRSLRTRIKDADHAPMAEKTCKVFIAAPMSGAADESAYQVSRDAAMRIVHRLRSAEQPYEVYFAGAGIATKAEFTPQGSALEQDMGFLRSADAFVLIYPEKVLSSVLIEAGYAMALGMPMVLFVRRRADLPYLLQEAESTSNRHLVPPITIREYRDAEDLTEQAFTAVTALRLAGGADGQAR